MKYVGRRTLAYGYPMPILMVATYNDDGSINVMNLHEATLTVEGDMALCIGEGKKTHENIEKRKAFTIALVNRDSWERQIISARYPATESRGNLSEPD
ncbi:hypothetical protein [Mitsuokella multacida]|uniref:hypothetical protein n=1 Tax=Mitsuokella multacida TaxID=52226 RepID=UPI003F7F174C